jgi:aconitate hydratase
LTGKEFFEVAVGDDLRPLQLVSVKATGPDREPVTFEAICRIDTPVEIEYFRNGGILHTVLRNLLRGGKRK